MSSRFNIQLITTPLTKELILGCLKEFPKLLQDNGYPDVLVSHGWGSDLPIEEMWEPVDGKAIIEVDTKNFGRISVTRTERDWGDVISDLNRKTYYCILSNRLVKLILFYRGTSRAAEFENVVLELLKNASLKR